MQIESKKSLKSRGFRSTDFGDALALTYAEDLDETHVVTQEMAEAGITEDMAYRLQDRAQTQEEENYDPLSYMEHLVNGDALR